MAHSLSALLAFALLQGLALFALGIRIHRQSKPVSTVIMYILDAGLGLFVVGDLTYLYLVGRAARHNAQVKASETGQNSQDRPLAKVVGNVAIKQTPNGVVVVHRRNGANYSETFPAQ